MNAASSRNAAEVYVVIVGYDCEDVRVFSTRAAADRFQTQNMANHSAPFACAVEDDARRPTETTRSSGGDSA